MAMTAIERGKQEMNRPAIEPANQAVVRERIRA
jgi:hypothetical protein